MLTTNFSARRAAFIAPGRVALQLRDLSALRHHRIISSNSFFGRCARKKMRARPLNHQITRCCDLLMALEFYKFKFFWNSLYFFNVIFLEIKGPNNDWCQKYQKATKILVNTHKGVKKPLYPKTSLTLFCNRSFYELNPLNPSFLPEMTIFQPEVEKLGQIENQNSDQILFFFVIRILLRLVRKWLLDFLTVTYGICSRAETVFFNGRLSRVPAFIAKSSDISSP